MTREEAAHRLGIHPNTLARYENDERPIPAEIIQAAASVFGVEVAWLRGMPNDDVPADADLVQVPVLDIRVSAGRGGRVVNDEAPIGSMQIGRGLLSAHNVNPRGARLMIGEGDSMLPTIQDGDPLLIDVTDREPRDKIFVVRRGEELLIKRLQKHSDGSLSLLSDNGSYAPERLPRDEADDLQIIGRVAMVLRSL